MCQSSKVRNKHDSPKAWAWALRVNTHSHWAIYRRQNGRLKPVAGSAQKWASPAALQSRMKSLRCQMAACAKPTNNSDNDNSDRSSDRIRQNNSSKMRGNQYRFTALKVQGAEDDPAPSIQTLRVKSFACDKPADLRGNDTPRANIRLSQDLSEKSPEVTCERSARIPSR